MVNSMKRIFFVCIVFIIFTGCTWLNMFNTNPEPSKNSYKFKAEKRTLAYTYVGKSKTEVKAGWGKSDFVDFNAPYCTKDNGDCVCIQDKCGVDIDYADERWRYTEKDRLGLVEWMYYSVDFYFKDGIVFKVR